MLYIACGRIRLSIQYLEDYRNWRFSRVFGSVFAAKKLILFSSLGCNGDEQCNVCHYAW